MSVQRQRWWSSLRLYPAWKSPVYSVPSDVDPMVIQCWPPSQALTQH